MMSRRPTSRYKRTGNASRREKPTSALAVLGRHPRIDPERIAVIGFSKEGFAALYSSLRRFARMHGPAGLTFARTWRSTRSVTVDRPVLA